MKTKILMAKDNLFSLKKSEDEKQSENTASIIDT